MSASSNSKPPGRGATFSPPPRYLDVEQDDFDDGWSGELEPAAKLKTTVMNETARSIISRNQSPDLPFDQSINPYRGCEHGCVYCYARPSHAYLDLSPGLDFESRLFAKRNAAALLRQELSAVAYACSPIALGANTDAYQPIERKLRITRELLEVFVETRHPVTIVTKAALIERDIDLLTMLAESNLVEVFVSVTSLDHQLARRMEPRATAPMRRIETLRRLASVGIPTGVMLAPMIAGLNDDEMEKILEAASAAGAQKASYIILRLPLELDALFQGWLDQHYPLRAGKVMNLMRSMRGGKVYESGFGARMKGRGPIAELMARRFSVASRALGVNSQRSALDTTHFRKPSPHGQLGLF
jgi:DNA repair photolyase